MKPYEDLGKQIVAHLSSKSSPMKIEELAFLTGSSESFVRQECEKLAGVNIITFEGERLQLNRKNDFKEWHKFKK